MVEETLSDLEAVTARMTEEKSLAALGELCARRGKLVQDLCSRQDLNPAILPRLKAVLRLGESATETLQVIREMLRRDLIEIDRRSHAAREWGANVAPRPRRSLTIDA